MINQKESKSSKLMKASIFGFIFGFLLQKGGVAKYEVIVGQLLLQDFTVAKIIMSAILVGMIGIYFLQRFHLIELQLKPTHIAANIIGGLVFGIGFAFSGYCPGTGAAALGQGNLNAIFYILGMLVGSIIFAELSKKLNNSVNKWGDKGILSLNEFFKIRKGTMILVMIVLLTSILGLLN
ncbi:MAG: YeeE/YedE family protein [Oligoflexia bacterium]|nr:YeeE/YedE family protein [Oligoflexia bacterium]MBF0364558.1 YeeE/YedE family protein [Oligoflexia bacterium]